jgi:hypothetical protein
MDVTAAHPQNRSVIVVMAVVGLVVTVLVAVALVAAHDLQRLTQVLIVVQAIRRWHHQLRAVDHLVGEAVELLGTCHQGLSDRDYMHIHWLLQHAISTLNTSLADH